MILSDRTIRRALFDRRIIISPLPPEQRIQPASVDLTLGTEFRTPVKGAVMAASSLFTILPGECMLGCTAEWVEVPRDMVARVEGKSSWGRRFILVHSTAGFIDPGFKGQITLELVNLSKEPQVLPVGQPICQISFATLDQEAQRPYGHPGLGSHYQGQTGATASAQQWP